jgi:hypothetical protein
MKRRGFILATSLAALILLGGALAIAGTWPFDSGSSSNSGRHVIWEGKVALKENSPYKLDVLPVEPFGACHCLKAKHDAKGQLIFEADNGIQGWAHPGRPSYVDCIILRNKLTYDSVALGSPRTTLQAVALHGWICATGGGNDGLIRLQYNGQRDGRVLFTVTSWGRPVEG